MSPVLPVTIQDRAHHRPPLHCVLKLYDRRFGTSLRSLHSRKVAAHTQACEAAFQDFVRRGMMAEFLRQLKQANEADDIAPSPRNFLDNTTEGRAKYEAALWYESNEHFRCETQAYQRLGNLQGKAIPRMLAHIRLLAVGGESNSLPTDLPPGAASCFEIRGILLEFIDGYSLQDMTTSPLAPPSNNPRKRQHIIQSAVDFAHEINRRGIIMEDCAPRNVVVDKRTQTPRVLDLAQCHFRDELVRLWREWGWHEDEEWDPDVEYWEHVQGADNNPEAIGVPMVHRMKKETGVALDIRYPDCRGIIAGIKRGKAEAESKRAMLKPTR